MLESENRELVLFRKNKIRCIIYNFAWKVSGSQRLRVAGDKNSRETFNLQRSKGTTRICSPETETFRLENFQLSLLFSISSIFLLFQLVLMVSFDILFFSFFVFAKKKKALRNCKSFDEDLSKRRFENV